MPTHTQKNRLTDIVAILKENISDAHDLSLTELIRKILRQSGYIAVVAAGANGEQELANLEKLIGLSNSYSNQGFKTPYDFIMYLEEAIKTIDDEGQPAVASYNNSVKILTIHQSKGLEFKVIFIFNCNDTSNQEIAKSKTIVIDKEFGILTALPVEENYFEPYTSAPIVDLHNYIYRRKNMAEIKRLLYVAITRAKDYLFISSIHNDYKFSKYSFMDMVANVLNADFSKDEFILEDTLQILINSTGNFNNQSKKILLRIPVTKSLPELPLLNKEKEDFEKKILLTHRISDISKEEIISATKISVFKQCPLKYQLAYELGFSKLFSKLKDVRDDFYSKEDDEELTSFSDVKGKVIHKILEQDNTDISTILESTIRDELDWKEISENQVNELKKTIYQDLTKYFASGVYKDLREYKFFKNEAEIYARENDYYLYGIIDRLIFNGNTAIIVDYKTDDIKERQITDRAANYINQLKFYGCLVSRANPEIKDLELRIIFIKHPDHKISFKLTNDQMESFRKEIKEIVRCIRIKEFRENRSHCNQCCYATNGKCIKENEQY